MQDCPMVLPLVAVYRKHSCVCVCVCVCVTTYDLVCVLVCVGRLITERTH